MKSYALNDTVHELLSSFATNPSGSLLITGQKGSGLSTAILYLTHSIYGQHIKPGEVVYLKTYTIDEVRTTLQQISRTRVNQQKPRLVIIDDAENLTIEAQNALLKNLEEPPERTHFVLASAEPQKLLSTIVSRCHQIKLKRPGREDLRTIFKDASDADFDYAYSVADGWPGALRELLEDKDTDLKAQIQLAKDFLKSNASARLIELKKQESEKTYFERLLLGLTRVSQSAMRSSAASNKPDQLNAWKDRVVLLHKIEKLRQAKVNKKLLGIKLALEL